VGFPVCYLSHRDHHYLGCYDSIIPKRLAESTTNNSKAPNCLEALPVSVWDCATLILGQHLGS
jgi:hypothetical protein